MAGVSELPAKELWGARSSSASGRADVDVVQPAQHRASDHRPGRGTRVAGGGQRRRQPEAAMRPVGVVVVHVFGEDAFEVPLAPHEHVVEALLAGACG
jgi:hypothetical protein